MYIKKKRAARKAATVPFFNDLLYFFMLFGVCGGAWGHAWDTPWEDKAEGVILDDFGESFWRLWGGPGRPGGDQEAPPADGTPEAY